MKKISRFAVELFINCKRCFVLSYKYKIKLRTLPFTLNSAVDNLCKNEFDFYRKHQKPHPIFKEYKIDAVPFKHKDMDRWRNNRIGISYENKEEGYHFYGAVDDVWVKPDGELIISDVKSTSKNNFDWEETWNRWEYPKAYKRQLEKYLISLECDDSWVKNKIKEALNVLNSNDMPNGSKACDTCQYLKKRWLVNQNL